MSRAVTEKEWAGHQGPIVEESNGFEVIDCRLCGFKHIIPLPTVDELQAVYRHEYYTEEKPLYIERHTEDLEWWDLVYGERYGFLEGHLPSNRRRLLDIGSGPGSFLLTGQARGWKVKGVEPSAQASRYSVEVLGLDVVNDFFSEKNAPQLGTFDAVNMSEVLEHIPDPHSLLCLAYDRLDDEGMLCINVPNDFNPFQRVLRDHLGFSPWWVAPPHHVNYFDFDSLASLVVRSGFEVVHREATFPIDLFLLMGDNYVGNDKIGRECHLRRMNFEKALHCAGNDGLKRDLYAALGSLGIGREITLYARKRDNRKL
ncbi:MAG: class I SAM-dependent methyltransferase [Chlorobiaceae bacterium]|nr:class I SAM-dependent methyltransferase [Chlorobiaceae bacterium]